MPARVKAAGAAGPEAPGRVLSVGQIDPQTNLMSVRVVLDHPDAGLKMGAFAQASIILGTNPKAILIPKTAVVTREGKTVVLIAGPDGLAHQRPVQLGGEDGGRVEVRSGVSPGERVIRAGQYELPDGTPVQPAGGTKAALL